jgi:transmembrane sensor
MSRSGQMDAPVPTDLQLEQATRWFLRVRSESAQAEEFAAFKHWLDSDPCNGLAYQQVAATWGAVGTFSSAPEIVVGRRDALDDAQRAAGGRWFARWSRSRYRATSRHMATSRFMVLAASVVLAVVGLLMWQYLLRGVYATDVGERRVLTLEDGSVVTLDARSRVRVRFDQNQRTLSLERGQARFDVARDPTRPFRVRAGAQTVVALGTQFNVELLADNVLVAMIEGRVAVTGVDAAVASAAQSSARTSMREIHGLEKHEPGVTAHAQPIELKAGEGIRVRADGQATVLPAIDVARATAWQSGKMFFDNEPLGRAAERVNRYSKLVVEVDPAVADVAVSGVFNAGDSNAFVEAISTYFPIEVRRIGASRVQLSARD